MKEQDYWNQRYGDGGDSGWCSIGVLRKWRWNHINKNIRLKDKSVLDVGCGDLRFWEGIKHSNYTGIDISSFIIEKNRESRPTWDFICADVSMLEMDRQFDVVLCFEMLFHIMTEESYIKILKNLNGWTGEKLFISCWSKRPEPLIYTHYQAHYQLEDYLHYIPDLILKKRYTIEKGLRAMYIFERRKKK